jgi:hypothetical protein
VLWVLPAHGLFPPELAAAGLHPDRLIYAETGDVTAVLSVAEPARLLLTTSRRLQIAAESSGVTAFVIDRRTAKKQQALSGTGAVTWWRLTTMASASLGDMPGLGDPHGIAPGGDCRGRHRTDIRRVPGMTVARAQACCHGLDISLRLVAWSEKRPE